MWPRDHARLVLARDRALAAVLNRNSAAGIGRHGVLPGAVASELDRFLVQPAGLQTATLRRLPAHAALARRATLSDSARLLDLSRAVCARASDGHRGSSPVVSWCGSST